MKARWMMVGALGLWMTACNGTVVDDNEGGGGAASTATSTGTATGTNGSGGDLGVTSTFTSPPAECVVVPDPPPGDWEPSCANLAPLLVTDPVLVDANGDGKVSPGETATLTVQLRETSGIGMYYYPLVNFTTDAAGVTVTNDAVLYGIAPCNSVPMTTQITVAPDAPTGEIVTVHAQVGALNMDCPSASAASVTFPIQP